MIRLIKYKRVNGQWSKAHAVVNDDARALCGLPVYHWHGALGGQVYANHNTKEVAVKDEKGAVICEGCKRRAAILYGRLYKLLDINGVEAFRSDYS